jgi:serine/threonine protein phosphatase PrpC
MSDSSWESFVRTDVGPGRDRNEDNFLAETDYGLFAVADGLGGRMSGDVASEIFVETLADDCESLATTAVRGDVVGDPGHRQKLLQRLNSLFLEANRKIYNTGQGEMGTTGDAILLTDRSAIIAHVGDSRTYLLRKGGLKRLTTDHTYAEQIEGDEDLSEEFEHVLTRSLGTHPHVEVDTVFVELAPDDLFLMCTDGVYKHLAESEIEQVAGACGPGELVDELVSRCREVGGVDNMTAVACRLPPDPSRSFDGPDSVETTEKLELLQEMGLFDGLGTQTVLQLLRHVYTAEIEPGEPLIEEGSTDEAMYIIVSGTATVRRDDEAIATIEPGDHVGEMALVDERERSADVVAKSSIRALRITPEEFRTMVESDPAVGNQILQNVLRDCIDRLRETTEQMVIERCEAPE